jgi:hypothetical protein
LHCVKSADIGKYLLDAVAALNAATQHRPAADPGAANLLHRAMLL